MLSDVNWIILKEEKWLTSALVPCLCLEKYKRRYLVSIKKKMKSCILFLITGNVIVLLYFLMIFVLSIKIQKYRSLVPEESSPWQYDPASPLHLGKRQQRDALLLMAKVNAIGQFLYIIDLWFVFATTHPWHYWKDSIIAHSTHRIHTFFWNWEVRSTTLGLNLWKCWAELYHFCLKKHLLRYVI